MFRIDWFDPPGILLEQPKKTKTAVVKIPDLRQQRLPERRKQDEYWAC